eukprot:10690521-Prorocentrum_lima.AAC.1
MTSSLVGSEMCIRDRGEGWKEADVESQRSGLNSHLAKMVLYLHNAQGAVSYTHLTLPTICSV